MRETRMIRISVAAAAVCLLVTACGPATGINSSACRSARVESQEATDRLQAALTTQARAGGGVSREAGDALVEMSVERIERANREMNRACELGLPDTATPNTAGAPEPVRVAEPTPLPDTPNTRYVNVAMTEERSSPGGAVVNRIYRGQRLEVTDREGAWVRVTELRYDPRWVRASDLSRERPAPLEQPALAPDLMDPRIQGIPGVGEEGHNEADVRALRMASAQLLASEQCRQVEMGNRSVNRSGVYWVNCGENSNRFFTMRDGEPHFCGRNADAC